MIECWFPAAHTHCLCVTECWFHNSAHFSVRSPVYYDTKQLAELRLKLERGPAHISPCLGLIGLCYCYHTTHGASLEYLVPQIAFVSFVGLYGVLADSKRSAADSCIFVSFFSLFVFSVGVNCVPSVQQPLIARQIVSCLDHTLHLVWCQNNACTS